jgi:hypothetical protein
MSEITAVQPRAATDAQSTAPVAEGLVRGYGPTNKIDLIRGFDIPVETKANIIHQVPETTGRGTERIGFRGQTKARVATFLDNYVTNINHEYWEPGGREVLNAQPHAKDIIRLLGGLERDLDDEQLKTKIEAMLDTPEGQVLSKVQLEQQITLQKFGAGLLATAELAKKGINPQDILDKQVEDRNKNHPTKRSRRRTFLSRLGITALGGAVGAGASRTGAEVATNDELREALVQAGHNAVEWISTIDPTNLATLAGTSLGAVAGWAVSRGIKSANPEQIKADFAASAQALESIKADPNLCKYIYTTIGLDVNDFTVTEDAQGNQTITMSEQPQSTANIGSLLTGIKANIETRGHILDDLGVPRSEWDVIPEMFLLHNDPNAYERTGLRVDKQIMDRYRALRRAADARGPEANPTTDEQRAQLLLEGARKPDDPLWGRGYENDLEIADFNPENINDEPYDRWGQQPGSRWYGRAPESEILFKDNGGNEIPLSNEDAIQFNEETGEYFHTYTESVDSGSLFATNESGTQVSLQRDSKGNFFYEQPDNKGNIQRIVLPLDRVFFTDSSGNTIQATHLKTDQGGYSYPRRDLISEDHLIYNDGSDEWTMTQRNFASDEDDFDGQSRFEPFHRDKWGTAPVSVLSNGEDNPDAFLYGFFS